MSFLGGNGGSLCGLPTYEVLVNTIPADRLAEVAVAYFGAVAALAKGSYGVGTPVPSIVGDFRAQVEDVVVEGSVGDGAVEEAGEARGVRDFGHVTATRREVLSAEAVESKLETAGVLVGDTGYCYLLAVVPGKVALAKREMGKNPVLAELVTRPREWFEGDSYLRGLKVFRNGDVWHLDVVDMWSGFPPATNFLTMLRSVHGVPCPTGSLGAALAVYPRCEFPLADLGKDQLGDGSSSVAEVLAALAGRPEAAAELVQVGCADALVGAASLSDVAKARQRVLQAVGDAALTLCVTERCAVQGTSAQALQEARTGITSNANLAGAFQRSVFFTSFAGGHVSSMSVKVLGGSVEALLGSVFRAFGIASVDKVAQALGLYQGTGVADVQPDFGG